LSRLVVEGKSEVRDIYATCLKQLLNELSQRFITSGGQQQQFQGGQAMNQQQPQQGGMNMNNPNSITAQQNQSHPAGAGGKLVFKCRKSSVILLPVSLSINS
jgi:hypothetical protein